MVVGGVVEVGGRVVEMATQEEVGIQVEEVM